MENSHYFVHDNVVWFFLFFVDSIDFSGMCFFFFTFVSSHLKYFSRISPSSTAGVFWVNRMLYYDPCFLLLFIHYGYMATMLEINIMEK